MHNTRIRDVMTTEVISVPEETLIKDVARALARHRVSAVPVVGAEGEVLGVVSEADVLSRWRTAPTGLLGRFRRRRATGVPEVAREVMTSPAITVNADAAVAQGAGLLIRHGIKRLPVVDRTGTLVGIVSRADLLTVLLRPDAELRAEVLREVFERELCVPPHTVSVRADGGVVTLAGRLERRTMIPIAVALTRRVDGVIDVVSQLTFDLDDTHLKPTEPGDYGVLYELWRRR
jgi:CBS domain-containing protein